MEKKYFQIVNTLKNTASLKEINLGLYSNYFVLSTKKRINLTLPTSREEMGD